MKGSGCSRSVWLGARARCRTLPARLEWPDQAGHLWMYAGCSGRRCTVDEATKREAARGEPEGTFHAQARPAGWAGAALGTAPKAVELKTRLALALGAVPRRCRNGNIQHNKCAAHGWVYPKKR